MREYWPLQAKSRRFYMIMFSQFHESGRISTSVDLPVEHKVKVNIQQ
jgi:hypothetical protein